MRYSILFLLLLFYVFESFAQDSTIKKEYIKIKYQDGRIASEGFMVNDKPDGFWKTFYVTGITKSEGTRKNFLLDSIWCFYTETGDTSEIIHYFQGKKNGYYIKFFKSTQKNNTAKNVIVSKELYLNDKKEGNAYYYYPDGSIHEVICYKNNRKNGTGREYDNNGNVISIYEFLNDYMTDKQVINRFENNNKNGVWKEFYDNGSLKSERNFIKGNLNGYSKDYDLHGNITLSFFYEKGQLVDKVNVDSLNVDERIVYYEDGKIYKKGNFFNNVPIGIHRVYNRNGDIENSFIYDDYGRIVSEGIVEEDGTKIGPWKNFFDDNTLRSFGVYVKNRQSGPWNFYFKCGTSEELGTFTNGFFSGEWKWFYQNGAVLRIENYKEGRREGEFTEFTQNGDTLIHGFYSSAEKNDFWISHIGDVIERGLYLNGLKTGTWIGIYSNGKLFYKGNYNFGNANGKFLYYFDNGNLMEEQEYANGIREKTWKKYFREGELLITITYEHDIETRINGFKIIRRR